MSIPERSAGSAMRSPSTPGLTTTGSAPGGGGGTRPHVPAMPLIDHPDEATPYKRRRGKVYLLVEHLA